MSRGYLIPFIGITSVTVGAYFVTSYFSNRKRWGTYPPGPKPLPIVGNILDLPQEGEVIWEYWQKLKNLYGPICFMNILGKVLVAINDVDIALELLEKKSKISSDRLSMTFSGDMVGWSKAPTHMNYGDRLLIHRKQIHQVIGTKGGMSRFSSLQEIEIRRFLLNILVDPAKLFRGIHLVTGAIILKFAYGYQVERGTEDPLVKLVEQIANEGSNATQPGRWLVDIVPILKYIPTWVPGADFKKLASQYRRNLLEMTEVPYMFVKRSMESGDAPYSLTSILLEDEDLSEEKEEIIKWTAAILYAAGVDTTSATLRKFILAMALFPGVQAKAQAEIDAITGGERFPTFEDKEKLPYVCALIKEILRWNPVTPVGLPHLLKEDINLNGYFIPKGATIIPNIWDFLNDTQTYSEPKKFMPERFLKVGGESPEKDLSSLTFGFGRRTCPGREFAESTIYLFAVMFLAVFNIEKPPNSEFEVKFISGIVYKPAEFEVVIRQRSEKAEKLIRLIEHEEINEKSSVEAINTCFNELRA